MKRIPIHLKPVRTRGRGRGSALLLVIVSLTLMAMLGAAYLQMARVDRFTTREVRRESHIDSVVEATLSQIRSTLRDDIFDDRGRFFNANNANAGGADESYDYPYTANVTWHVKGIRGNILSAKGGQNDDTWLAATAPTYGEARFLHDDVWPHITNLNGIYLNNVGQARMPNEVAVGFNDTDTPIPTPSDPDWVDADGDGVKDSRWTWAPIFKMGDLIYVMAVRIIDNSSLINLNTATAMTSNGEDNWTEARGYFPTGVDLSRLFARYPMVGGPWEWQRQLYHPHNPRDNDLPGGLLHIRDVGDPDIDPNAEPLLIATPLGLNLNPDNTLSASDPYSRLKTWEFANIYGDPTHKFSIDDELELRYRGGLNNPHITTLVEDPDVMSDALMAEADPNPLRYDEIPLISTTYQYFQGNANSRFIKQREFRAIRHMLTTISGTAVFAPNHDNAHTPLSIAPNDPPPAPVLKYDLVHQDGGSQRVIPNPGSPTQTNQDTRINNIASRLNTCFRMSGPSAGGILRANAYLGFQTPHHGLPPLPELNQIAYEFALAIQDYSDIDSTPSRWRDPSSGITYYGMEMLPFIREVYIQVGYKIKDIDNADGDGIEETGDFEAREFENGSQAVAVELGNPFDQLIPAASLNNQIRIAIYQDTGGPHPTLISWAPLTGMQDIPSHGKLIVYSNPSPSSAVDEAGKGSDLSSDLGFTGRPLPGSPLTFNLNQTITVTLEIDVNFSNANPPNWVPYDRLTHPDFRFVVPNSYPITPSLPDTDPDAVSRHGQGSLVRPCTNSNDAIPSVHYLSNINKGLVEGSMRLPDQPNYRTNQDKLGDDDKTTTGNTGDGHPMLDSFQLPLANRQILSVAELGWIHMFGFSDAPDGDFPQRLTDLGPGVPVIPQSPQNAGRRSTQDPCRWTLHFRPVAWPGDRPVDIAVWDNNGISPYSGIPHAGVVMDQFTTLSPRYDDLDNDMDEKDGIDNNRNGETDELDEHHTHLQNSHLIRDRIDNDQDGFTDEDDEAEFFEQFVPGTININTVPLHLATLAAPLPEDIDDIQSLMEAIFDYRERINPNASPNRSHYTGISRMRNQPGIASIGELMFINPPTNRSFTTRLGNRINNRAYQMQRYAVYNTTDPPPPSPSSAADLYPLPEQTSTPYNPPNSAEKALARFQFLSQVFTTRSDIFTAYVVIHGYPAKDMSDSDGVPVESVRFFAVLDRSGMTSVNDLPRVLGIYGLD